MTSEDWLPVYDMWVLMASVTLFMHTRPPRLDYYVQFLIQPDNQLNLFLGAGKTYILTQCKLDTNPRPKKNLQFYQQSNRHFVMHLAFKTSWILKVNLSFTKTTYQRALLNLTPNQICNYDFGAKSGLSNIFFSTSSPFYSFFDSFICFSVTLAATQHIFYIFSLVNESQLNLAPLV